MKKLFAQIIKFGLVGVLCFFIDYFIYLAVNAFFTATGVADAFPLYYLVSAFLGFTVSVIVNYLLSMKYVFVRKEDMSRRREFIIFIVLSVIGLGINELCLYVGIDLIYGNWRWLQGIMSQGFAENVFFKCGATGVVMVYNFVTRKKFLSAD